MTKRSITLSPAADEARHSVAAEGQLQHPDPIAPAFRDGVLEGMAEARRGEFADPAAVEAFFRRFTP